MSYSQRVDREHPACMMFLIDQSYSMSEPLAGAADDTKAKALARAVNDLLYELVIRSVKDPSEGPRAYYDVGVIGYGNTVGPAWSGALAGRGLVSIVEVANNPTRMDERADGTRFPIWFEPEANGPTPMSSAIDQAGRLVAEWIGEHPSSLPPIVINISDGASTDGDPLEWGRRIESLSTSDGSVLLFNVNFSNQPGEPLWFPDSPDGLPNEYARSMFELSSPLPGFMQELAGMEGHPVSGGSRGFVFNADINSVVGFLQIGTSTQHVSPDIMGG